MIRLSRARRPRFRGLAAAIAVAALGLGACDREYPVRFVCSPGGPDCPASEQCPELPLAPDRCGELPGLFGHPPTPVTTGRPIGCMVWLSYGNPYYGDSQQTCTCEVQPLASSLAMWSCPL
jgi:hypothetical protein